MSDAPISREALEQAVRDAEAALAAVTPPALVGLSAFEARRRALIDADTAKQWAGRGRPSDDAWIVQAAGLMVLSVLFGIWLTRLTPLPWYGAVFFGAAGGVALSAFAKWRGRKKRVDTAQYDAMAAAYGTAEPSEILTICATYEKLYTVQFNARKALKDCAE